MLGEVRVGVDEARENERAATIDHAIRRPGRPDIDSAPGLHDALAVDEDGAVPEDAALGIHGDDDGVLDEDHGYAPAEYDTRHRMAPHPALSPQRGEGLRRSE